MGNTKTVKQYENSVLQMCITGELRTKRTNDFAGLCKDSPPSDSNNNSDVRTSLRL